MNQNQGQTKLFGHEHEKSIKKESCSCFHKYLIPAYELTYEVSSIEAFFSEIPPPDD